MADLTQKQKGRIIAKTLNRYTEMMEDGWGRQHREWRKTVGRFMKEKRRKDNV